MQSRLWLVGVAAAVAAGALARVACLGAEFWLDEIWSLELARQASSPLAVLFRTKHDNNHHLNTLYLYFAPDGVWWGWYRLHSLLAGVLAVAMAAKAARRWGKAEAVIAAWLIAGCSWLVLASAEARGYSLAVLFALVAFDALWGYLETRSRFALVVYWLATILGFLSHLTFMFATIGFVVWSLRRFARERTSAGGEVRELLICHGVPGLLLGAFGVVAILGVEKGGGPPASAWAVVSSLINQGLGAPGGSALFVLPLAAVAVVLFVGGVILLRREGSDLWVFFVACCVAAPGLYLVVGPEYRFERYFFIPFTFFLLLAARALASLVAPRAELPEDYRARWRFLVVALVALFVVGNAETLWLFAEGGRGHFHEAIDWVAQEDDADPVRVGGDFDFRVEKYVRYYGAQPAPGREILYLPQGEGEPEWLFTHRFESLPGQADEPPEVTRSATRYRLVKSYPSRGPGACGWFVYRRVQEHDVRGQ